MFVVYISRPRLFSFLNLSMGPQKVKHVFKRSKRIAAVYYHTVPIDRAKNMKDLNLKNLQYTWRHSAMNSIIRHYIFGDLPGHKVVYR